MLSLAKAHAYGNDFLFIPHEQAENLDHRALARHVCDRHRGVGGDGLILYTFAPDRTARMTLYNTDGSPSELSGNGLRCLAALALHLREDAHGLQVPGTEVNVDTDAGWKALTLVQRVDSRYTFCAAMGHPTDVRQETLSVGDEDLQVTTLGMGNPQCVVLVEDLPGDAEFHRLGPMLSTHPRFGAGTNVEFVKVEAPDRLRILIWERGVGPTHASGTGACASAVTAMTHGAAERDVEVSAPGGTQRVEWREDGIFLTGWAEVLFTGEWIPRAAALSEIRSR